MAKRTAAYAALLPLLFASFLPARVQGDCVDYREYVRRVGVIVTKCWDVTLSGDLAFISEGDLTQGTMSDPSFIKLINVSNPSSPYLASRIDLNFKQAYGLAVSGTYLYASTVSSFRVFDVSDPQSPSLVGTLAIPGFSYDVAASGSYAYIVQNGYFQVIDTSNPSLPAVVGSVAFPGSPYQIEVFGSYVYVGLTAIDVSNPASPTILGGGVANNRPIAFSSSYAFVADASGLKIYDVTTPGSSIPYAELAIFGGTTDIALSGNHVLLSGGSLQVVDVSDPAALKLVGVADITGKIAANDSHAYVANSHGFYVVEIIKPTSPFLGIVEKSSGVYNDVAVSSSYAYATHSSSLFEVIDVSTPELPTVVGSLSTPSPLGVVISGDRAYVTDALGLNAIDVSTPASPLNIGSLNISGATAVAVSGSYAYVACNEGLQVVDIASASPSLVASVPVPEFPCHSVALSGSYAYVTGKNGYVITGFRVIDVSDPQLPTIVGGITFENSTWPPTLWDGIAVEGAYAYVASSSGLEVVDVSNAAAPFVAASLDMGGVKDVAISGAYAYVNMGYNSRRVDVVDIQDPLSPTLMATMGLPRNFNTTGAIATTSSYHYAVNNGALVISSLFCPGPCTPHLTHPNGGENYSTGVHTVVRWEYSPLQRCTVNHAQLHYSPDGGVTWDLVADVNGASYVWRAPLVPTQNGRFRVSVMDFSGVVGEDVSDASFVVQSPTGVGEGIPTVNRLYQNSPNPFQGATQVMFDLAAKNSVILKVFDIKGAEVRRLAHGSYPAGHHEVSWDARDDLGRPVAEGIYFLHMDAGSFRETKRLYVRR